MVLKSKIFARINMLSFVFLKIPSMNVIPSKIGHDLTDLREKVVWKLKLENNVFFKKCPLKLLFFNEKISSIFYNKNRIWKYDFEFFDKLSFIIGIFISFLRVCWFSAENLAFLNSPFLKFHNRTDIPSIYTAVRICLPKLRNAQVWIAHFSEKKNTGNL